MEKIDWKKKWEDGETKFHREAPHPQLIAHFSALKPLKVVVPLCGKSQDLVWLRSQGHEVVGIELSPIACEAFFAENRIPFVKTEFPDATLYRGERISLWCTDFFKTDGSIWAGCGAVYDRAALIALPAELRKKYAAHLIQNLKNQKVQSLTLLLISIEYVSEKVIGPPFPVFEPEIQALYGADFVIERLHAEVDPSLTKRPGAFQDLEVSELSYRFRLP